MSQDTCLAIHGHLGAADSPVTQACLPECEVASTANLPLPTHTSAQQPATGDGGDDRGPEQPSTQGVLMPGLVLWVKSPAGSEGTQGERLSGPAARAGTQQSAAGTLAQKRRGGDGKGPW